MKAHYQAVSDGNKKKNKTTKGAKTNRAEERGWMCDEAVRRETERENESAAAAAFAFSVSKDRCFPKINIPTQSLFICVIPTLTR